jgi:glycosyltransferase involved in cell wall biosynthesis
MAVLPVTSVSVVIPTTGSRRDLLQRAINSTRPVDGNITTEVIVVANGKKTDPERLQDDAARNAPGLSVRVVDAGVSTVGMARNVGLAACGGEIIRFLDDDDYLIPAVAHRQYMELRGSDADLSTYAGRIEDASGRIHQVVLPGALEDYGRAVLGPRCPALTFATIYRSSLVRPLRWNTSWQHTEDEDWMRRILQAMDPVWIQGNEVVGAWYQHDRQRLSKPYPVLPYYRNRATSILDTVALLESDGRMTGGRRDAAAAGLWSAIHGGFYFSPFYWTRIARIATRLQPGSRPEGSHFAMIPRRVPPLLLEWLVLP